MTRGLGAFGEAWAVGHLQRLGYRIVDRNVRFRVGEIDIVAVHGDDLVFVEVKCRQTARYGTPEASITSARYARLAAAVQEYLQRRELDPPSFRIDVVAIEVGQDGRVTRHNVLCNVAPPDG